MNLIPVRYLLPKGAYIESLTGYICVDVMGQVGWVDAGEREGETGLSVKRRGGGDTCEREPTRWSRRWNAATAGRVPVRGERNRERGEDTGGYEISSIKEHPRPLRHPHARALSFSRSRNSTYRSTLSVSSCTTTTPVCNIPRLVRFVCPYACSDCRPSCSFAPVPLLFSLTIHTRENTEDSPILRGVDVRMRWQSASGMRTLFGGDRSTTAAVIDGETGVDADNARERSA